MASWSLSTFMWFFKTLCVPAEMWVKSFCTCPPQKTGSFKDLAAWKGLEDVRHVEQTQIWDFGLPFMSAPLSEVCPLQSSNGITSSFGSWKMTADRFEPVVASTFTKQRKCSLISGFPRKATRLRTMDVCSWWELKIMDCTGYCFQNLDSHNLSAFSVCIFRGNEHVSLHLWWFSLTRSNFASNSTSIRKFPFYPVGKSLSERLNARFLAPDLVLVCKLLDCVLVKRLSDLRTQTPTFVSWLGLVRSCDTFPKVIN